MKQKIRKPVKQSVKKVEINLTELLQKSKFDSKIFSKSARRQALDTVRETKILAGHLSANCEQFALEYIGRVRTIRVLAG
jgi:hypothetical protein